MCIHVYAPNNKYTFNKEIFVCLSNCPYVNIAHEMTAKIEETSLLMSVVHGHHDYKSVWTPCWEEHLHVHVPVHPEMVNNHNK